MSYSNPYNPPSPIKDTVDDNTAKHQAVNDIFGSMRRRIAVAVIISPLIIALPLHLWAVHYAGSWYVSARLDGPTRARYINLVYAKDMATIIVIMGFIGTLLLYLDAYKRN